MGYLKKLREKVDILAMEYFDTNSLRILREKKKENNSIAETPPSATTALLVEVAYNNEEELEQIYEKISEGLTRCNSSIDETWGAFDEKEAVKIKEFRHALPEAINEIIRRCQINDERIHKVSTDMAVPEDSLVKMLSFYNDNLKKEQLRYAIFGHIGDNHLHVNILPNTFSEMEKAKSVYLQFVKKTVELGGTISAEHGIGKIKAAYLNLLYTDKDIEEMRTIKRGLDPYWLLGRGPLLTSPI
ncbi:MAG: FAD-linked oxidase C-terminal domain-containing protein [bacterium]